MSICKILVWLEVLLDVGGWLLGYLAWPPQRGHHLIIPHVLIPMTCGAAIHFALPIFLILPQFLWLLGPGSGHKVWPVTFVYHMSDQKCHIEVYSPSPLSLYPLLSSLGQCVFASKLNHMKKITWRIFWP